MFSSTTTELSTTMPTANAMPASEMMLMERPRTKMKMNVETTVTGMATPMIMTLERLPRNRSSTPIASAPPMKMLLITRERDWSM